MKRLLVIVLAVLVILPTASLAAAQRSIDMGALGDELASTDSERLLMRLNTPIPDTVLGESFANARLLASGLLTEQRAMFDETLEGLSGSIVYTVDYTPSVGSASPAASPGASPEARTPQAVFSSSTLTYLLFAEPVDTTDMEAFGATMQEAMGSEAMEGEVEQITINDAPAVRISSVAVVNAVDFHTQWIAVPVGNVVVVAMVIEGSETFDEQDFRSDNESLARSGIVYLDAILNG